MDKQPKEKCLFHVFTCPVSPPLFFFCHLFFSYLATSCHSPLSYSSQFSLMLHTIYLAYGLVMIMSVTTDSVNRSSLLLVDV